MPDSTAPQSSIILYWTEDGRPRIDYRPVHLQPLSNDIQSIPPKPRVY